ncbi:ran GTPase-activating protein [Condylostylus longicornis]|uniref:ran GTPase-activating protein n=1 Tax=Condylostylus longicornis TaxID=2530218 RepID=UPI00244DA50E|nr:ran GTPase-activating protein [Condylostylus longicornis]
MSSKDGELQNFSFTKLAEELDSATSSVSFEGKSNKWENEAAVQPVIDEINKSQKLTLLNLEGNTLGVEAAKAIGQALQKHPEFQKALWKDLFTGRLKTEIPLALKEMCSGIIKAGANLTVLDCSDNALGPNGMIGLVDFIKSSSCYSLQELKLNNCGLGVQGGKMLADALLSCHESSVKAGKPLKLKVFIAGRNRLENEGAKALAKVFAAVKTLEEIAMPQNGIYHIGIAALSDGFKENENMRVLDLNDNTITSKGAVSLASAFKSMQKLRKINFGDCLLKTKGALLLAEAIQNSHADLEILELESNEIEMNGGITVASAVGNKENLKILNLDCNQFGGEGCITIQEIMEGNGKLDCLASMENDEGDDDGVDDTENEDEAENEDDYEEEEEAEDKNEPAEISSYRGLESISLSEDDDCDVNYIAAFCNKSVFNNKENSSHDNSVVFIKEEELANTIENFIECNTTSKMFMALTEKNKLEEFRNYLKKYKDDDYLIRLTFLVLKCSDVSTESAEALDIAVALYKDAFDYAKETNQISRVRTFFLIQLGLLKCEDKSFKPAYDLKACRNAAKIAVDKKCFPDEIESSFKLFLEKFGDAQFVKP